MSSGDQNDTIELRRNSSSFNSVVGSNEIVKELIEQLLIFTFI